ncbi:MAG: glucose-1-phosphate cytidylyltransferase [Candidatus Omnitrophica bacterium]|nr:glucose-1-phosphate cytidylyltransferase [Candidatus Omnitrophota bacterium]MDD5774543.1 glucose-1-phosphate cytidylyltransferase [Candidatus Omnitrophota bacterium]
MAVHKVPVVILCGGRGTRLKEETDFKPKPMVEIGGRPILWHIMKRYAYYGFKDFVLALGYKGDMIKEYFLNYEAMNNDFTVTLGKKHTVTFHTNHREKDWSVTLVDTGEDAMTGARVKRIEKYIKNDAFMLTYGDGVSDIDLKALYAFHLSKRTIGTVSAVRPSSRFGEIIVKNSLAVRFNEKPQTTEGLVNGGFFVFDKSFFTYISDDKNCYLEREPLERLAADGQLAVNIHKGFWQCMDTQRELDLLVQLWAGGNAPWKVW